MPYWKQWFHPEVPLRRPSPRPTRFAMSDRNRHAGRALVISALRRNIAAASCCSEECYRCGHSVLQHAAPPAGSIVRSAPAEISLWFSEPLEPAFSRVEVYDAKGQRVDNDDSQVAGGSKTARGQSRAAEAWDLQRNVENRFHRRAPDEWGVHVQGRTITGQQLGRLR